MSEKKLSVTSSPSTWKRRLFSLPSRHINSAQYSRKYQYKNNRKNYSTQGYTVSSKQRISMEKQEIVDEMDHGFFAEQGYMVHPDDLEGKGNKTHYTSVVC